MLHSQQTLLRNRDTFIPSRSKNVESFFLEGLVAEYLSLVPHDRKFVSISTGDLITTSIKWRPEFSLAKAANAFRAVEQYAANLINQPWRQEFWKIRQYSGFYKHSVETALSGADKLFQDMGYAATSNQVIPCMYHGACFIFI